jgi:hypothetical protein
LDTDDKKQEKLEDQQEVEAQYIEVAAPLLYVIAKALVNAVVTFLTMQFMKTWWKKWKGETESEENAED